MHDMERTSKSEETQKFASKKGRGLKKRSMYALAVNQWNHLVHKNLKKWGLLVEWLSSSISGKFCKMTSYQKAIVSECNMSSSFWPWQFFQRELFPPKRHCVSWYCRHTKIHQKLRASLQKRKSLPFSTEVLRSSAAAFFCIVRRHNSLLVLLISQLVPLLREQSMERYISFLPWNVGLCRKLFFLYCRNI